MLGFLQLLHCGLTLGRTAQKKPGAGRTGLFNWVA
jgi:hypothetical protein